MKEKKLSKKEGRKIELPKKENCPCLKCKHFVKIEEPKEPTYMTFSGAEIKHAWGLYCTVNKGQPCYLVEVSEIGKGFQGYPDVRECTLFEPID